MACGHPKKITCQSNKKFGKESPLITNIRNVLEYLGTTMKHAVAEEATSAFWKSKLDW